jgi:hypothetical protein
MVPVRSKWSLCPTRWRRIGRPGWSAALTPPVDSRPNSASRRPPRHFSPDAPRPTRSCERAGRGRASANQNFVYSSLVGEPLPADFTTFVLWIAPRAVWTSVGVAEGTDER